MPIYAYRCSACGHAQDVLQKMSDPLLTTCPACGAEAYVKQLTAAGFQLKGSGWYVTDFREGAKTKDPKDAKAEAGDKPADGSADKPADKPDAKAVDGAAAKPADSTAAKPADKAAAPAPAAQAPTPPASGS
jgi:putative FmdB family regulatory protein